MCGVEWRFDVSEAAVLICNYDEDHVCQHAAALLSVNFNHTNIFDYKSPASFTGEEAVHTSCVLCWKYDMNRRRI